MNIIDKIRTSAELEAASNALCGIVGRTEVPDHLRDEILAAAEELRPLSQGFYIPKELKDKYFLLDDEGVRTCLHGVLATIAMGVLEVGKKAEKHAEEKLTHLLTQP